MNERESEQELSILDKAIQHFAEYIVRGQICIYERDLPVRSIIVSHNGLMKRIEIAPDPHGNGFVQNSDAWLDDETGRKSWADQPTTIPTLPRDYADQMKLLHAMWSRVEVVSSADVTAT
jgi:hypothetical protein